MLPNCSLGILLKASVSAGESPGEQTPGRRTVRLGIARERLLALEAVNAGAGRTLRGIQRFPFTNGETEAQGGKAICQKLQASLRTELRLEPRTLGSPSPLTAFLGQDPASLDLAPGSWRSGSLRTFMRGGLSVELRLQACCGGKGLWWEEVTHIIPPSSISLPRGTAAWCEPSLSPSNRVESLSRLSGESAVNVPSKCSALMI